MSSSDIRVEMQACEFEMAACREEIARLSLLLDNQTETRTLYLARQESYYENLEMKETRKSRMERYAEISVLALRYEELMGDQMSTSQKVAVLDRLDNIESALRREVQNTQDLLEYEQNRLRSLESRLADLQRQYQAALQREAEERARAQSSSSNTRAQGRSARR